MYDQSVVIIYFISFLTSVIGSVCGIGGGVILKPVLDSFQLMDVSTISFLSGCTVLSMTCYSVADIHFSGNSAIDFKISTFLGIGAAAGGCIGKYLFEAVKICLPSAELVGAVQSAALFLITMGTLLYNLQRHKIHTKKITNRFVCVWIGGLLGLMSSFLGIGGGPVNLVLLYFCFSMETKAAVQNSLYIILISQTTSLIFTAAAGKLPEINGVLLAGMAAYGVLGGVAGRKISCKIASRTVNKLFVILMLIIVVICIYNFVQYL